MKIALAAVLLPPLSPFGSVPAEPPLVQTQELLGSDTAVGDRFGDALAMDGPLLVVGAHLDNNAAGVDAGAAYVFRRANRTWSEEQKLVPLDPGARDEFGDAVAISGERLIVGASRDDDLGEDAGAAYVFRRDGGLWIQEAKLLASSGAPEDLFGSSVAIDGDTALVGSPFDDRIPVNTGAVYVYVRSGTTWSEQAKLVPSQGSSMRFGFDVGLDADRAVVGAPDLPSSSGAGFVFERSGTSWTETARLTLPIGASRLGNAVGSQGDTLFVGAPWSNTFPAFDNGSVRVFSLSGASWTPTAVLEADDASTDQELGTSADLCGDWIVGGAPMDSAGGSESGLAYVFRRRTGGWDQQARLTAPAATTNDRFGTAVGVAAGIVAVGAPGRDSNGNSSGSVFVFESPYPSFCDAADGSLAACPCANPGDPDTGCDLPQATGGVRLEVLAQATAPENRTTLVGSDFPAASSPTAIVVRGPALDGASPVVFGDGLRCVATPVVRLRAAFAVGGVSTHAFGHGAGGGTFFYQLWFRSTPVVFCDPTAAFNLSNGRELTW